ncbi:MAG: metallophosphoesterase family protein [Oscillospiraceae bacterium]
MKFIHITDTHLRRDFGKDEIGSLLGAVPDLPGRLERMLSSQNWDGIDFAVFTGDLIHEGKASDYAFFKEITERSIPENIPVLTVLGNHDYKDAFYEGYLGKKGSAPYYYTMNIGGYRLIVLDSAVPGMESGTVLKAQLSWLRNLLAEPYGKGSILFLHHPLIWGGEGGSLLLTKNADEVLNVLKGTDVFAVFCGHTHSNSLDVADGIIQETADSAAFSLEVRRNSLAFTAAGGYSVVEIDGRSVSVQTRRLDEAKALVEIPLDIFAQKMRELDREA